MTAQGSAQKPFLNFRCGSRTRRDRCKKRRGMTGAVGNLGSADWFQLQCARPCSRCGAGAARCGRGGENWRSCAAALGCGDSVTLTASAAARRSVGIRSWQGCRWRTRIAKNSQRRGKAKPASTPYAAFPGCRCGEEARETHVPHYGPKPKQLS
jgi:hypothetical protein